MSWAIKRRVNEGCQLCYKKSTRFLSYEEKSLKCSLKVRVKGKSDDLKKMAS